jgi:hypothetical protein
VDTLPLEVVPLASLHAHPRNYQSHPDDELTHLRHSLTTHGWYKNAVIAEDDTILAGHGVITAAMQLGWTHGPVRRLPLPPDHPEALKVLVGDNEVARLAFKDDRALTELLKQMHDTSGLDGLVGTGFDATMLAGLVYVTRPAAELQDKDHRSQWVGLPDYQEAGIEAWRLLVSCRSLADREQLAATLGVPLADGDARPAIACWWPPKVNADVAGLQFEDAETDGDAAEY